MEIIGIGTDLIEINRIQNCLTRFGNRFIEKIFTHNETKIIADKNFCISHIAKRWAAKEACIKALNKQITWQEIEIHNLSSGQPIIKLLPAHFDKHIAHLSLTDEKHYAVAMQLIVKLTHQIGI